MKTLKQILEVYSPKSADEKRFVKKHIVVKTADVAGNGDDVYAGAAVKEIDRKKTRKGYNTKDSEAVYEATYNKDVERAFPASGVKIGASAPKGTSTMPKDPKKAKGQPVGKMKEEVELDEVKKPMSQKEKDKVVGAVTTAMRQSYANVMQGRNERAAARMIAKIKSGTKGKTAKEEIEQVDELKKSTLRSYVDKAKAENLPGKGGNRGVALLTPGTRDKGVHKAVDRMKKMKEEVEQVNELEKSTLKSYIDKARVDIKQGKKSDKREAGIKDAARKFMSFKGTANKKVAKEEVEVNEVLKVSAGAGEWIKDFSSSDNPKFAGKSKEQRKQQALAAYYAAKRAGKE
jgi:hypothetical protein